MDMEGQTKSADVDAEKLKMQLVSRSAATSQLRSLRW